MKRYLALFSAIPLLVLASAGCKSSPDSGSAPAPSKQTTVKPTTPTQATGNATDFTVGPRGQEVKQAFNADAGKVRVVMLVSPT